MTNFIKKYFNLLNGRIIFWNIILLVFVKIVFPHSAFQLASFMESLPTFDSREIIKITNEARIADNLPPLKVSAQLDLAAADKLNDMAENEYFAHISPSGATPWAWIKKTQYNYSVAGENLAIGFFTAKETVQAWMNSPSHKANLTSPRYQDIGVAVRGVKIKNEEGVLVVQMFGSPRLSVTGSANQDQTVPVPAPQLALSSPKPINPALPQTQGESVTLFPPEQKSTVDTQPISTDIDIEAVREPLAVKFHNASKIQRWSILLNNTMVIYLAVVALFSIMTFIFLERGRMIILKTSFNVAMFVISVLIPASQLSFRGLIF